MWQARHSFQLHQPQRDHRLVDVTATRRPIHPIRDMLPRLTLAVLEKLTEGAYGVAFSAPH
jgi:hypothetical protein